MGAKFNEHQEAWAESLGLILAVKGADVEIRVAENRALVGRGDSIFAAVTESFVSRRKVAESYQSALGVLVGLGEDPEDVLDALDEVFPTDDGLEGDEEEESGDVEIEER